MCDACKPSSPFWDHEQNAIISRVTNRLTGNPMLIITQQHADGRTGSVNVEINYCPWCGERLTGGADDD